MFAFPLARDYKYNGTAQINSDDQIIEKIKCSLGYSNHSYAKKIESKSKIENNEQSIEVMKDILYQEQFFQ